MWTVEKYLAFERASEEKHEYLDGNVNLRAAVSARHNIILGNTLASLHAQLRKTPCTVYPSDMRLKVSKTGLYTYPDISVVCDEPEFEDDDILLNPVLIVEVLSPSTENYDRGKKFQHYRKLASFREYLLISQDSYRIEHYVYQNKNEWVLSDIVGVDSVVELTSINCRLALADVYEKVTVE